MSVYQVRGRLGYRGHKPGDVFEATLDPLAEARAVRRGNILVLEESKPELQPGSYTLPVGWVNSTREEEDDVQAHRAQ